jgi:Fe-S oxidoreductase
MAQTLPARVSSTRRHAMPDTKDNVTIALEVMEKGLTRQMETWLNVCAHCGLCNDACHYFLSTNDPHLVPTYKTDKLRNVWRKKHDWIAQVLPWWVGAVDLTEERLQEMSEIAFRDCTLCGRCVVNCPFGVDTRQIVRTMRAMATATGKAPEILDQLADSAIQREESLDSFKDFFLEQIADMTPELRELTGDPDAVIPVNQKARVLYVPLSGKHTILPAAALFHASGEYWTLSLFDASNYAVFLHDIPRAKRIVERIVNEAKRLECEEVVITECGHAYSCYRWSAPNWFDGGLPFKFRSIVEVIADWIETGKIKVAQLDNSEIGSITLHDPCNLGRNGGVFDEPRQVLKRIVPDFIEMTPNRQNSICCGGGSGLVANLDYEEQRIQAGKPKADQIRATGAQVVVASCDNCRHQIGELSEHYELGVTVMGLTEITLKAMVKARTGISVPG